MDVINIHGQFEKKDKSLRIRRFVICKCPF